MVALALIIAAIGMQVRAAHAFRQSAPTPDDWGWIMSDAAKAAFDKGIRSAAASVWLIFAAGYWVAA